MGPSNWPGLSFTNQADPQLSYQGSPITSIGRVNPASRFTQGPPEWPGWSRQGPLPHVSPGKDSHPCAHRGGTGCSWVEREAGRKEPWACMHERCQLFLVSTQSLKLRKKAVGLSLLYTFSGSLLHAAAVTLGKEVYTLLLTLMGWSLVP